LGVFENEALLQYKSFLKI